MFLSGSVGIFFRSQFVSAKKEQGAAIWPISSEAKKGREFQGSGGTKKPKLFAHPIDEKTTPVQSTTEVPVEIKLNSLKQLGFTASQQQNLLTNM